MPLVLLKNGNLGLNLSEPDHRLAVAVTTNEDNPDGDGIALVNTETGNYWNIHMSTLGCDLAQITIMYHISIQLRRSLYVQTSDRSLKENISRWMMVYLKSSIKSMWSIIIINAIHPSKPPQALSLRS